MTSSSIAQYLDQKRVVRPIEWASARPANAQAPRARAPLAAAEPAPREPPAFRRMTLAGAAETAAFPSLADDPAQAEPNELPSGRRGAGLFRPREPAPPPEPDIETLLAEAYHRGVQEGLDAGRNEAATQRAMERADLQKRAVVERLDFQMNEYAKLAEAITQGLNEIERRVAASMASILRPFLSEAVSRRAIEDLALKIAKLTTTGHPALFKISGPEQLLGKLASRIEPLAVQVEYAPSGAVEITVEAAQTSIQSELAPWADLIAKLSETR